MNETDKVFVADHQGMVGAAIRRQLIEHGHPAANIVTLSAGHGPLQDQATVQDFLARERPDQIYLPVWATHGSTGAQHPATALLSLCHVIHAASVQQINKLVLVGTPHVYPQAAMSPMAEEDLLTGRLDPATETSGLAQIAAIKLCEALSRTPHGASGGLDYRCLVTPTPYGPGDAYPTAAGHTVAGIMYRLHQAKVNGNMHVNLPAQDAGWHEYLHVDDVARAAMYLMNVSQSAYRQQVRNGIGHLNAGDGKDCSVNALAHTIAGIVSYTGALTVSAPRTSNSVDIDVDTQPRHRLDSHRMRSLGWRPALDIEDGLALTYFSYLSQHTRSLKPSVI